MYDVTVVNYHAPDSLQADGLAVVPSGTTLLPKATLRYSVAFCRSARFGVPAYGWLLFLRLHHIHIHTCCIQNACQ